MKLRSCLFSPAFAVGLLLISSVSSLAQEPGESNSTYVKTGQAVFVSAVRGDCGRQRPNLLISGREGYVTAPQPAEDRPTLDRPPNMMSLQISDRLEPDLIAKRELEEVLSKAKKFRLVGAPEEADFIFHTCSRYLYDVYPMSPRLAASFPYTNRRLSAQALVLPVTYYRRNQNSYRQLLAGALWRADAPEYALAPNDPKVRANPKRPGQEEGGMTISGGPKLDPPPDAAVKKLAEDFMKQLERARGNLELVQPPNAGGGSISRAPNADNPRPLPIPSTESLATAPSVELSATGGSLRLETLLVSVPVMVLDRQGKYIPGLKKDDFKLFEDGLEQKVESFTTVEEPFSVVLMLDSSESTRFRFADIKAAALAFVEQLRPQDEVMVVSFDTRVWIDSELTNDRDELRAAISKAHSGQMTRLYDALYLVLTERLRDVRGRKAIVLFSDGIDSFSRISDAAGAVDRAEKYGAFVYTIQYETERSRPSGLDPRSSLNTGPGLFRERATYDAAVAFMKGLASRSGGNYYEANSLGDLSQAFSRIAEELRQQYLLTYYPSNTKRDGQYRRITVQSPKQTDGIIRAREGYQAKGSPTVK